MAKQQIKTTIMLIFEAIVIWYGMDTPIPTNWTEAIKLIVALLAITYTAWKNHDFTEEACIGTGVTRQRKAESKEDYLGERFSMTADGEICRIRRIVTRSVTTAAGAVRVPTLSSRFLNTRIILQRIFARTWCREASQHRGMGLRGTGSSAHLNTTDSM